MTRAINSFYIERPFIGRDTFGLYGTGCSISPNNRYLYINDYYQLYQYDLWAADIPASRVLIGDYDGFYCK